MTKWNAGSPACPATCPRKLKRSRKLPKFRTTGATSGSGEAEAQESRRRSPISVSLRSLGLYAEDLSAVAWKRVFDSNCAGRRRKGLSESSPVRSAGLAFLRAIRPERDDRPMLAIAEQRARPNVERFDRP